VEYFVRAKECGNMEATMTLGLHYLNGIGTPQDEWKASECFNLGGNPPTGQHMYEWC
jgi:TPR repeat protein